MITRHSFPGRTTIAMILVMLTIAATPAAWAQPGRSEKLEGRRLGDALRVLQLAGLRIVFSTETVTPDMRVVAEPRAARPRAILDEIVAPHDLRAEDAGVVIQIVRAKPATRGGSRRKAPDAITRLVDQPVETPPGVAPAESKAVYTERVTVTGDAEAWLESGPGTTSGLGGDELRARSGVLANDALRAAQSLPRAAAADDFKSAFSVRGSPFRQVGIVVDGVATPWLEHTAYGRGDSASLSMITGDLLDHATLQVGAYPQKYVDRLGAQLTLTLREGSRTDTRFRAAVYGSQVAAAGEGPLGAEARGSWLVAVRQSYRDWPMTQRNDVARSFFGFTDAQAKLVYDVRPTHQISVSALTGRAGVDERDDRPAFELGDGTNRTSLLTLAWRATLGSRVVLQQRASIVDHRFTNQAQDGAFRGRGGDRELAYRAEAVHAIGAALVESGAEIQRVRASRHPPPARDLPDPAVRPPGVSTSFEAASWIRSGYGHVRWTPAARITMALGTRLAATTQVEGAAVGRWLMTEWWLRPGWTLTASAGVSHQFPTLEQRFDGGRLARLAPERAAHLDFSVQHRVRRSLRWQATIFARAERDVLRAPDRYPRIVGGALTFADPASRYENALTGSARGVELLLERASQPLGQGTRRASRLSGWIAYSYGRTRHFDAARRETFWADFDQRHAVNLSGIYRLSDRMTMTMMVRGGSSFPMRGYFASDAGHLFAGSEPNRVRLPGYARLDLRADRTWTINARRLTLFVEAINVLNRSNWGFTDGVIDAHTGQATGFTRRLYPRLPSAGLAIEF